MIEIIMRPSIIGKLLGAVVCAGLSVYNLASSNDQVLIRSANSSSSRTEVRVFESPSKQLNLMSGVAFGLMFCVGVYLALNEYNSVVEEIGDIECTPDLEDHPHQSQQVTSAVVAPVVQQQPTYTAPFQQPPVQEPTYATEPPSFISNGRSHLRLVPPIASDVTAPYLIPPNEFVADMESEDYWADNTTENKG